MADLTKVNEEVEALLSQATSQAMTETQFNAYAEEQIAMVKADMACDDEDKKKKAAKRLQALKSTLQAVAKAGAWEGSNGTAMIPIYEEPNLTAKTEESSTEHTTPPAGNVGTQADTALPFAKGIKELNATIDSILKEEAPVVAAAPAQTQGESFAWPDDLNPAASNEKAWGKDSDPVK